MTLRSAVINLTINLAIYLICGASGLGYAILVAGSLSVLLEAVFSDD